MPTKKTAAAAPAPVVLPALTRVRLDVSPAEHEHLRIAAARAGVRGMSQYVRELVQEDMKTRPAK